MYLLLEILSSVHANSFNCLCLQQDLWRHSGQRAAVHRRKLCTLRYSLDILWPWKRRHVILGVQFWQMVRFFFHPERQKIGRSAPHLGVIPWFDRVSLGSPRAQCPAAKPGRREWCVANVGVNVWLQCDLPQNPSLHLEASSWHILIMAELFAHCISVFVSPSWCFAPSFGNETGKGLLWCLCISQIEASTSPPRAIPRAFELLKIGLFKFLPLGAKKLFKCPTN